MKLSFDDCARITEYVVKRIEESWKPKSWVHFMYNGNRTRNIESFRTMFYNYLRTEDGTQHFSIHVRNAFCLALRSQNVFIEKRITDEIKPVVEKLSIKQV